MMLSPTNHDAAPRRASDAAPRRAWLARVVRVGGWRNHVAAGLLLLDAGLAIGFAAGLAQGLTALPEGLPAAAPWLALGTGAAIARGGGALLRARVAATASADVRTALRRRMIVASLALPAAERPPSGELMTLAVDGVESMDLYVARFLPARAAAGLAPLLIAAAVACRSTVSAAILLATLIPFVALMILAGGAAAVESRRQLAALVRLSGLFADRVCALPLLLAFQAETTEAANLAEAAEELRKRTIAVLRVAFVSSAGLEFFAALSVALVAVYAGFSLLHLLPFRAPEPLTLSQALFALALAPEFYLPLRRLAASYHERQAAETAADGLMRLEAGARPLPPSGLLQRPRQEPCQGPRLPPRIRFEAVTVRYPGDDRAALCELEFTVPAGGIGVLLGPSGSGKTTALNLLLGLAPLIGGEVWIDDTALSETGSFAGSVAWAGQAPMIIPGSIADNIALSRRTAARGEIASAAALAGMTALLDRRPGGLDATVDERGGGLSGGERRRIALARALLKPAPILLLDEPTAHLDHAAEAALIEVIRTAARGRTTIIATHSAPLARLGDTIIRLDHR